MLPAILTGFTLAFARALGEYGSVIFISGNLPMKTEITPLLIVIHLEEFDYHGAAALGFVMLATSFVILLAINLLQAWGRDRMVRRGTLMAAGAHSGALEELDTRPGRDTIVGALVRRRPDRSVRGVPRGAAAGAARGRVRHGVPERACGRICTASPTRTPRPPSA